METAKHFALFHNDGNHVVRTRNKLPDKIDKRTQSQYGSLKYDSISNVTSAPATQMEVNRNHWKMHLILRIHDYDFFSAFIFFLRTESRLQRNHFPKCEIE